MLGNASIRHSFGLYKLSNVILLSVNLAFALLDIWRSSFSWAITQEKGLHSTTGEPFIWAIAVVPVLAVVFLINAPWGLLILRRKQWDSGRLWIAVGVIWLVAIAIDFAHH